MAYGEVAGKTETNFSTYTQTHLDCVKCTWVEGEYTIKNVGPLNAELEGDWEIVLDNVYYREKCKCAHIGYRPGGIEILPTCECDNGLKPAKDSDGTPGGNIAIGTTQQPPKKIFCLDLGTEDTQLDCTDAYGEEQVPCEGECRKFVGRRLKISRYGTTQSNIEDNLGTIIQDDPTLTFQIERVKKKCDLKCAEVSA